MDKILKFLVTTFCLTCLGFTVLSVSPGEFLKAWIVSTVIVGLYAFVLWAYFKIIYIVF